MLYWHTPIHVSYPPPPSHLSHINTGFFPHNSYSLYIFQFFFFFFWNWYFFQMMRVKGIVQTLLLNRLWENGGMFDWWDEIDKSQECQTFIFHLLTASYAFVSFVALVFFPFFFLHPHFYCFPFHF